MIKLGSTCSIKRLYMYPYSSKLAQIRETLCGNFFKPLLMIPLNLITQRLLVTMFYNKNRWLVLSFGISFVTYDQVYRISKLFIKNHVRRFITIKGIKLVGYSNNKFHARSELWYQIDYIKRLFYLLVRVKRTMIKGFIYLTKSSNTIEPRYLY